MTMPRIDDILDKVPREGMAAGWLRPDGQAFASFAPTHVRSVRVPLYAGGPVQYHVGSIEPVGDAAGLAKDIDGGVLGRVDAAGTVWMDNRPVGHVRADGTVFNTNGVAVATARLFGGGHAYRIGAAYLLLMMPQARRWSDKPDTRTPVPARPVKPNGTSRRKLLRAGVGLALLGGGGFAFWRVTRPDPPRPAGEALASVEISRGTARSAATTPDGEHVWVAAPGGVFIIATADDAVTEVDLPSLGHRSPESIAFTPDGRLAYLAVGFEGTVSVVDVAGRQVVGSIDVAQYHYQKSVVVAPDGRRLYVSDSFSDKVLIVDVSNNSVIGAVAFSEFDEQFGGGGGAWDLAVTRDSRFLYVTRPRADAVSVVDTLSGSVVTTIGARPYPRGIVASATSDKAYVATGNSISVLDTAQHRHLTGIAVAGETDRLAITRDGGRVFATLWNHKSSDGVAIVDTQQDSVVESLSMGGELTAIAADGDGTKLYLADAELDILTVLHLGMSEDTVP